MSEIKKKGMENSMKHGLCHLIIQGEFLVQNTLFTPAYFERTEWYWRQLQSIVRGKEKFPLKDA